MKSLKKALIPERRPKTWRKFYECDCGAEGIMMSTEDLASDATRQVYLALFQNGWNGKKLSFTQKLRWIWHILIIGYPYGDCVLFNTEMARELAKDLKKFADGKLK